MYITAIPNIRGSNSNRQKLLVTLVQVVMGWGSSGSGCLGASKGFWGFTSGVILWKASQNLAIKIPR